MRLVIDMLGAPVGSGGMSLYAEQVLRAWRTTAPDDELIVVATPWLAEAVGEAPGTTFHVVREGAGPRAVGQWIGTGLLARRARADAVLSLTLVVSPLSGRRPRICIAHDWRHVRHPDEFPRTQRAYRRTWAWSAARATRSIQISTKTDRETAQIAPRARRVLVANGQDHPSAWPVLGPEPGGEGGELVVVTFGHRSNKRAGLVIQALREASTRMRREVRLVVLGATGALRESLHALAVREGVADRVDLPGFVPTAAYQDLIQRAALVVLASSDEGFGLPVAEARFFGIPVLSTDDSGLAEIHGDRVHCAAPTPVALGSAIAALLDDPEQRARPADIATWADTVRGIRAVVAEAIAER